MDKKEPERKDMTINLEEPMKVTVKGTEGKIIPINIPKYSGSPAHEIIADMWGIEIDKTGGK